MKKRVTKDFETRSKSNLKKEGAYKYSLDPSTQPTCLAFKILGEPTVYFLPFEVVNRQWKNLPEQLRVLWKRLIDEDYEFSAHNSFFERCIYDNILVGRYGWPKIPPRRRRCTAAKAAACALPRNLEGAGEAMKLRIQKDKRGYVAMMATCKPTKQWNAWNKLQLKLEAVGKLSERQMIAAKKPEPPLFLEPEAAPDVWQTLYTYCKIDVRTEEILDQSLPDLIPAEQEVWFLNQMLNWRGLRIDLPTVRKATTIMEVESVSLTQELDSLTMGLVTKPGALKSILEFLALDGIVLPNLRAKTVEDILQDRYDLDSDMRRLLEIRQALSKSSTKKYKAFVDRATDDCRVRDILLYNGASTGRDTGTGIQIHNLPRGLIKIEKDRPYAAVENIVECDREMLKILYGESLSLLFSAVLRNMIMPSEGHELFVADFSKIEVAVLWWLADNVPGLKVLNSGLDPYKYMASTNTGKSYNEISDEGEERQLGKAQVLGCGFGMGADKFQKTAWDQYRLKLTSEQSKKAVMSYREANETVPLLWKTYERAAIEAVESGKIIKANRCKFFVKDKFLWVELPSGRRLAYREPQIAWRVREYEKKTMKIIKGVETEVITIEYTQPMKTLEFWAVNSKTKKWALERTWGGTLTENIVQATARDLLMPGLVRLEKRGYRALFAVHDEGICERPIGQGSVEDFVKILCERPAWAEGLPLEAKGWSGPRYRK